MCVLEVKVHFEEQNEFFHIKGSVEDIFKSQFSTFSPIIQLSSEEKKVEVPSPLTLKQPTFTTMKS